jgi:Tfp pilus assembly protein PilF
MTLPIKSPAQKLLLIIAAFGSVALWFFVFKWAIANTASTQTDVKEIAEFAAAMSPRDSQTRYALAVLQDRSFLPADQAGSLAEFEAAAALSPHDYRYWLSVATARERDGNVAVAEAALNRAEQLAPNYAPIAWAKGNFLLRQKGPEEAVNALRAAVEKDGKYAAAAANALISVAGFGPESAAEMLGGSASVKAEIALALARSQKFNESVSIWRQIPAADAISSFSEQRQQLYNALWAAKKFNLAAAISPDVLPDAFSNPGFEDEIRINASGAFTWQIAEGSQPAVGLDSQQKNSGSRSLAIIFNAAGGKEFRPVSQTVGLSGGANYRLKFFYKAEINSGAGLRFEVANAADGTLIASSGDLRKSTVGWQEADAAFRRPDAVEAVTVRLVKTGCVGCSVDGKIWFDDFSLTR